MKELNINEKIDNNETFEIDPNKRIDTTKFNYSRSFEDLDPNKRVSEINSQTEVSFILEKQQKIKELNSKLKAHLEENKVLEQENVNGAFLYEPHCPEAYYAPNNLRIEICDLETYSTDKNFKGGINTLTGNTLYGWTDKPENKNRANPTITNVYDLNYCLREVIENKKKLTTKDVVKLRSETKPGGKNYYYKFERQDKTSYSNFRYSIPTDTVKLHEKYIKDMYNKDPYYTYHYREALKIKDPHILIIGGQLGVELLTKNIFPELEGKLTYCGEPVIYKGRMIVSIPHPSRITNEDISETVNKILGKVDFVLKEEIPEKKRFFAF